MITEQQITKYSGAVKLAPVVAKWFNTYKEQYEVTTDLRIAAFLAQVIHESGSFRYTREIASGNAYENRVDLGNIFKGDGVKFKGHGYIQVTGRNNHATCSLALFGDRKTLLETPELLCTPQYAMQSAFWFWGTRKLNIFADLQEFKTITKRINGGLNHFAERVKIYNVICEDLGLPKYIFKLP